MQVRATWLLVRQVQLKWKLISIAHMFDLIPNRNFPSTVFQIKLMMLCVDSFFFIVTQKSISSFTLHLTQSCWTASAEIYPNKPIHQQAQSKLPEGRKFHITWKWFT